MQVNLAALAKSEGTRTGVTNQVFTGDGITIPADQSVTGKESASTPPPETPPPKTSPSRSSRTRKRPT